MTGGLASRQNVRKGMRHVLEFRKTSGKVEDDIRHFCADPMKASERACVRRTTVTNAVGKAYSYSWSIGHDVRTGRQIQGTRSGRRREEERRGKDEEEKARPESGAFHSSGRTEFCEPFFLAVGHMVRFCVTECRAGDSRDECRNEVWEYLRAVNVRTVEPIIRMPSSSHNPVVNRL